MNLCVGAFSPFQLWDLLGGFSIHALEVDLLAGLPPSMAAEQCHAHSSWMWIIVKVSFLLQSPKMLTVLPVRAVLLSGPEQNVLRADF